MILRNITCLILISVVDTLLFPNATYDFANNKIDLISRTGNGLYVVFHQDGILRLYNDLFQRYTRKAGFNYSSFIKGPIDILETSVNQYFFLFSKGSVICLYNYNKQSASACLRSTSPSNKNVTALGFLSTGGERVIAAFNGQYIFINFAIPGNPAITNKTQLHNTVGYTFADFFMDRATQSLYGILQKGEIVKFSLNSSNENFQIPVFFHYPKYQPTRSNGTVLLFNVICNIRDDRIDFIRFFNNKTTDAFYVINSTLAQLDSSIVVIISYRSIFNLPGNANSLAQYDGTYIFGVDSELDKGQIRQMERYSNLPITNITGLGQKFKVSQYLNKNITKNGPLQILTAYSSSKVFQYQATGQRYCWMRYENCTSCSLKYKGNKCSWCSIGNINSSFLCQKVVCGLGYTPNFNYKKCIKMVCDSPLCELCDPSSFCINCINSTQIINENGLCVNITKPQTQPQTKPQTLPQTEPYNNPQTEPYNYPQPESQTEPLIETQEIMSCQQFVTGCISCQYLGDGKPIKCNQCQELYQLLNSKSCYYVSFLSQVKQAQQAVSAPISFPSIKIFISPFTAIFSFLDDFWYYRYHDRAYQNQTMFCLSMINQISSSKMLPQFVNLSFIESAFNISYLLPPQKTEYLPVTLANHNYKDIQFLPNTQDMYTQSYLCTIAVFAATKLIFVILKIFVRSQEGIMNSIYNFLREKSLFKILFISLIQSNIIYIAFNVGIQLQMPSTHYFGQKINLIFAIVALFIVLIFSLTFYILLYQWCSEKDTKVFLTYNQYSLKGVASQMLINSTRNLLCGLIHSYVIYNYRVQMILLIAVKAGVIVSLVIFRKFAQKVGFYVCFICYFLTGMIFDIILLLEEEDQISKQSIGLVQMITLAVLAGQSLWISLTTAYYPIKQMIIRKLSNRITPVEKIELKKKTTANLTGKSINQQSANQINIAKQKQSNNFFELPAHIGQDQTQINLNLCLDRKQTQVQKKIDFSFGNQLLSNKFETNGTQTRSANQIRNQKLKTRTNIFKQNLQIHFIKQRSDQKEALDQNQSIQFIELSSKMRNKFGNGTNISESIKE